MEIKLISVGNIASPFVGSWFHPNDIVRAVVKLGRGKVAPDLSPSFYYYNINNTISFL